MAATAGFRALPGTARRGTVSMVAMNPRPDVQLHELLAERDFVRTLARQLLGEHDGDDVAQDAWLRALDGGRGTLRSPRAWLARIVHRLASNRRRDDRRRAARERAAAAAAPPHAPSTDAILACEQVRQRVVAAVLALDEPFRGVVIARFYECLDTAAIAARDGVPEATVRSRCRRGLDRLRARLDADHGTRAAWAAPLALLGREPMVPALPVAAATTGSKKAAVLLAAVLLVGLTLWAGDLLTPVAPAPAQARGEVATTPADATDHDHAGDDAPRSATATPSALASGEPRERVPYPLTDEPIDEVPVRVLDAETRQPVAGAEVLFLPFRIDFTHPATRGDQRLHELANSEAMLERFGSRARTDEHGAATIRMPRSGGSVIASHGDLRKRADIRPQRVTPGQRVPIWLDAVRWVRLRAVAETTGAPVEGALLDVRFAQHGAVVARAEGRGGMFGPSDAAGAISIPLTRTQHTLRVRPWAIAPGGHQAIELPAAFERVTDVRFPATGSITIELRTPSGELWPMPIEAGISCRAADIRSPIAGPITWCRAGRGTYRAAHVALGLTWKVSASGDAMQGTWFSTTVVGPRVVGEEVRVMLCSTTEPCIVWADVRTADGSMLPTGSHWLVCQGEGGAEDRRGYGLAEPDGRVGWTVNAALPPSGRIQVMDAQGAAVLIGSWRLDAATSGVHELGTLALHRAPIVVAGRIDTDATWHGAPLRVCVETTTAGGEWRAHTVLDVDASVDPTFAVRGTLPPGRVRVAVMPDAHCLPSAPQVVDAGTKGVRLAVARGLALRARVLAPPAHAQSLRVRAARTDGATLPPVAAEAAWDQPGPRGEATLVDFDGTASTFAWPALPDGWYRLDVLAPGVARPIASIDGVHVGDGAPPDPRLDPIDLRERVRTLVVSLVPLPSGPRPVTDGGALAFASGAPGDTVHGMLFDARGEARLAVGVDPVDVIVAVPGFRVWRAEKVTVTALQVQLEPPLAVPFRLAPRVAERLAGHRVHVELDPVRPGDDSFAICFRRAGDREPVMQTALHGLQRLADGGRGTLADTRGAGTIPVAAPGRFAVRLAIETATGHVNVNESWKDWQSSPIVPAQIDVGAAATPELVVDVEEATLAKVAERLSRGR